MTLVKTSKISAAGRKESSALKRQTGAEEKLAKPRASQPPKPQESLFERVGAATEELASGLTQAAGAAQELAGSMGQIASGAEEAAGASQQQLESIRAI